MDRSALQYARVFFTVFRILGGLFDARFNFVNDYRLSVFDCVAQARFLRALLVNLHLLVVFVKLGLHDTRFLDVQLA